MYNGSMGVSINQIYDSPEPIKPAYRPPLCPHNRHLSCHWQPCPLSDRRFTANLDRYCERYGSRPSVDCSQIAGPGDPVRQTTPHLDSLETASWFDDREALERYARWRVENRPLRISRHICEEYRAAYCRWFVRLAPAGARRPRWMRGWSEWAKISNMPQKAPNLHDVVLGAPGSALIPKLAATTRTASDMRISV